MPGACDAAPISVKGNEDMDSRERIQRIIAREPADRCGLWMGNPYMVSETRARDSGGRVVFMVGIEGGYP
jgi:hypothetical protein